ncbi:MAG TPA: thymidylate kinase [Gemmatimonadales bacterium]|nr:thymidylate kinase [Gemmatimonadales bacterium]
MGIHDSHDYPGRLIVVEGIDGSGKSTQLSLLQTFLVSEGYDVSFTEWNSSPIVKDTTRRGKKKNLFSPTTFSLIHATDFADRHERSILPPLQAGLIVLADRYAYTAFARDVARGCDPAWVRGLYQFATRPDLALYFRVDIDTAVARITGGRIQLKFHEAGMDLGLSPDPITSFRVFQTRVIEQYDRVAEEFDLTVLDGSRSVVEQQREMRRLVKPILKGLRRAHAPRSAPAAVAPAAPAVR